MKDKIGIVEIGSTNTKAYICLDDAITDLGFITIEFKKNYNTYGTILSSDVELLVEYVNKKFSDSIEVSAYATSVFRDLDELEKQRFEQLLKKKTHITKVNVVSSKMENELTVIGAIRCVSLLGNVCVMIGGGGSTEISICNSGEIIEMVNTPFGVTHVLAAFPDLTAEYANTPVDDVTEYVAKELDLPKQKADYLILAGGDFLLRYNNASYPVQKNTLFSSANHPYIIDYEKNREYESTYYHEISLEGLRKSTPNTPKWWNGTRAMCAITNAVARAVNARVIIPTSIPMVYGIAEQIKKKVVDAE